MPKQILIDFTKLSEKELIGIRVKLDKEFKRRGIKFSVGEIGETLSIKYFNTTPGLTNLQKAPAGVKNVDALSRDGQRYSIKTVQKGIKTGTIYFDEEDKELQLFEFILLVRLDENYDLIELYRFSWKQFVDVRLWDKRMNAWYLSFSSNRLIIGEKLV